MSDQSPPHPAHQTPGIDAAVLAESVRRAVGAAAAQPRPGQGALSARIADIFTHYTRDHDAVAAHRQHVGQAPTGSGKALAYLAPAMVAATVGRRTVISTESLALQGQIVNKDAPVAAAACDALTGVRPSVAVLKGWGNYVCLLAATERAYTLLGEPHPTNPPVTAATLGALGDRVNPAPPKPPRTSAAAQARTGAVGRAGKKSTRRNPVSPTSLATKAFLDLDTTSQASQPRDDRAATAWALQLHRDHPTASGEKRDWHGEAGDLDNLTISREDCLDTGCPLYDMCYAVEARQHVADADIVVTNHTLLGIQAAIGAPIVTGNTNLGPFDHIVIDEAHGLPGRVRDAGAAALSARALNRAANSMLTILGPEQTAKAEDHANRVGRILDDALNQLLAGKRPDERVELHPDQIAVALDEADAFAAALADMAPTVTTPGNAINVKRARNRAEKLRDTIRALADDDGTGYARWVHRVPDRTLPSGVVRPGYTEAACSPVEVGTLLAGNLWRVKLTDDELDNLNLNDTEGSTSEPKRPLAVIAVSATMPISFPSEAGIAGPITKYPSPFTDAYQGSAVYVPGCTHPDDINALARPGTATNPRPAFDTTRHPAWAEPFIVDLVNANNGHALILGATAAAARRYADTLRANTSHVVYSQWDYGTAEKATALWREHPASVLVGTRSLMTGVDAAGETCTLVIIDRVPRAAANPVDDARVRVTMERTQTSKWDADAAVYAGDAATLLAQAAGRLIRSETDRGMVAILDPRLHKAGTGWSVFTPAASAQRLYKPILDEFGVKIADRDRATAWLKERANQRAQ